jgi:hypothetical protein
MTGLPKKRWKLLWIDWENVKKSKSKMFEQVSKDVFGLILSHTTLGAKRALLQTCKRFYWLVKHRVSINVVPLREDGKFSGICLCCRDSQVHILKWNKDIEMAEPIVPNYKMNRCPLAHVSNMSRLECEYGHVLPCHTKDVKIYGGTACPVEGCKHKILMPVNKRQKKK